MRALSKHQFLALAALQHRPAHPHAVRQEIIELTGRQVWPSQSTLRAALNSLLAAGYIDECCSDPHYWLKARRGAPYELTELGSQAVRRELSMYFEIVVKSRNRLQKFAD